MQDRLKTQDWWRGSITYQIYPRSFQDSNADGIGDLQGITQRLPHIAGLGVDAIWLSPVFTSPMADMGYDVSDYRNINPEFGTLADFDTMVTQAHELGLKVIIDQVLSHSSAEHAFFQESRQNRTNPKADWYVWADPKPDGAPPNNWLAIFGGGAWQWESRRRQYYLHNFLAEQPDFNFHHPEVQDWHLDNMRFWLERGVDGFRLDTVNFYFHDALLRHDPADFRLRGEAHWNPYDMQYHIFSKNQPENPVFLERIRALLNEYAARTTIGEVGDSHHSLDLMGEYTSAQRLHMCYSFEMLADKFSAQHFRHNIEQFFKIAPDGWPCWAFSNHDVMRHVSRWQQHSNDTVALAKQAAALLLSLEGSICLYQGEELGQTETTLEYHELTDPQGLNFWPENKGRDGCRTPMVWDDRPHGGFSDSTPWLPVKQEQLAKQVAGQQGSAGSVLECYRALIKERQASISMRNGRTRFYEVPEPLLAFKRGDNRLCVFNLSPDNHQLTLPEQVPALTLIIGEGVARHEGVFELAGNGFGWFELVLER